MAISLNSHDRQYALSPCEALYSPIVSPYGMRHLQLSFFTELSCSQRWGHRVIAVLELIPIIGFLASIIERVVAAVCACFRLSAAPVVHVDNDAQILVDFCKNVPFLDAVVSKYTDLSLEEQAAKLREHLQQDPAVGKLSMLDLSGKGLKELPKEIGLFKNLTHLSLDNNNLTSLPDEICTLTALEELFIQNNELAALPASLGDLEQLRILAAPDNKLTALPDSIENLAQLTELNLPSNQIAVLASGIGKLKHLTVLGLENNAIEEIPPEIGNLSNLEICSLHGNPIKAVPKELSKLNRLEMLTLRVELQTELPQELTLERECLIFLASSQD